MKTYQSGIIPEWTMSSYKMSAFIKILQKIMKQQWKAALQWALQFSTVWEEKSNISHPNPPDGKGWKEVKKSETSDKMGRSFHKKLHRIYAFTLSRHNFHGQRGKSVIKTHQTTTHENIKTHLMYVAKKIRFHLIYLD